MLCSEKSNRTFRLQNKTAFEFQSIKFSKTFKNNHGRKVNTYTSCVSKKPTNELQKNFNKVVCMQFFNPCIFYQSN